MKKRLSVILCILLGMMLLFCACGKEETPAATDSQTPTEDNTEQETPTEVSDAKFAFVEAGVHAFYAPFEGAVTDAAGELGIDVPTVQAPSQFVQEDQNKIIDAMVAQGITGLAMQPSDAVAANEKISEVVKMGIPVVGFGGAPATPTDMTFCLATDVGLSAYEGTLNLIESMGGSGNIVHLTGGLEDVNTVARMEKVQQACDEKGCTLIQTITDVDDTEAAQNALNNLLAAQGDEVDGIIATGYNCSVAIATTFRQKNETRIKAIGCDTDEVVLQAIRDGFMTGTMSQNPYGQAYLCTYGLNLFNQGYTWKDPEIFFINSGFYLINASNVDNTDALAAAATEELKVSFEDYFVAP